ncbi:glycosyl hydrolase family 28-related protein [Paenibacillus ginsengarvi]|uniref:glycosyl hydrolase family 28-related protein n=1 Tax=Paenibacillus ginsengarvi TaxID=400777 RepID=UPI001315768C|nr:glycosyl hydrolase family 28-related protein [Paenibacillus ginsengarvi]
MSNIDQRKITRRKALAALGVGGIGLVGSTFFPGSANGEVTSADSLALPHLQQPCIVTTIHDLRSIVVPNADSVYYVKDPGQEGFFYYDPADKSSVDDTGTVLVSKITGARFKRNIPNGVLNVKWFGAKGKGSVDDTAAIQNAIDAANNYRGGVVIIPSGDYFISSAIRYYSYSHIVGMGKVSVKIWNRGSDYAFKPHDSSIITRHASIESLRITGHSANTGGILVQNCNECIFENIEFGQIPGIGLHVIGTIGGCYWNNVSQCTFLGTAGTTHSIKFDQNSLENRPNANKVHQCVISGGDIGIEIVSGDTIIISETGISDTTGPWLKVGGNSCKFIANRYENHSDGGGIILTPTSYDCILLAESYTGKDKYTDSGRNNLRLSTSLALQGLSVYRQSITPSNNANDSFEFVPHQSFAGDVMRVYTNETKTNKTLTIDKMGNITTKGSVNLGEGTSFRLPNLPNNPSDPQKGTMFFDTRINKIKVWTGSKWETVTSS